MGILFQSEIENILILSKMVFLPYKACAAVRAAPVSYGSSCVSGPPWGCICCLCCSHLTEIETSEILKLFFQYQIGTMTKRIENKKNAPNIYLLYLFFKKYNLFKGTFWGIVLWPKVVQQYFHLKTCCIVND